MCFPGPGDTEADGCPKLIDLAALAVTKGYLRRVPVQESVDVLS